DVVFSPEFPPTTLFTTRIFASPEDTPPVPPPVATLLVIVQRLNTASVPPKAPVEPPWFESNRQSSNSNVPLKEPTAPLPLVDLFAVNQQFWKANEAVNVLSTAPDTSAKLPVKLQLVK